MQKEKLKVWFRQSRCGRYIDAVFLYDRQITTYAHVGQHGSGSIDWLYLNTRPATPGSYQSLLAEISEIYSDYDLQIQTRLPPYQSTLKAINTRRDDAWKSIQ